MNWKSKQSTKYSWRSSKWKTLSLLHWWCCIMWLVLYSLTWWLISVYQSYIICPSFVSSRHLHHPLSSFWSSFLKPLCLYNYIVLTVFGGSILIIKKQQKLSCAWYPFELHLPSGIYLLPFSLLFLGTWKSIL